MILIWSGEGGPLQWLCLIIFCIQFFAPQLIQLSVDIRNAGGIGSGRRTLSQDLDIDYFPLLWVAACLTTAGLTMWICMEMWQRQQRAQQQQTVGNQTTNTTNGSNRAESNMAPYGSAGNPVVIEDDENNARTIVRRRVAARINTMLRSLSPAHFMLALGFALPLIMSSPLVWNLVQSRGVMEVFTDSGFVQISVLAVAAHSVMAIAAYRVLRDVLESGGVGPYPGNNRQGGRRRLWRKLTVSEIADIVRKVPVEEFVSEDDVKNGDCSIARMKRMLCNRGASEAAERCLERDELVREIEKTRNFNEECAICAEEYVEGDVLRVPTCRHEFHLHCFDKWIYTFSTESRPTTHPTCPLCKTAIE